MNAGLKKCFLVAVFAFLTAGEWLAAPAYAVNTNLTLGGTGAGLGTMELLAAAYEKLHPGVAIKVISSLGSAGGINATLKGALDIAISGRPLKEEERKEGAVISEYARTPFVFIVHKKVAVNRVTSGELEKIYGGRIASWPDGTRIRLITRPEKDTDTMIIKGISPAMEQAVKSAGSRVGMILAATDQESADRVEKTTGAMGGSSMAQVISEGRNVKVLSFNGVKPGENTLRNGSYPLFKSLYLVTTAKSSAAARQFVEFVRSPEGRKILAKNGNLVVDAK